MTSETLEAAGSRCQVKRTHENLKERKKSKLQVVKFPFISNSKYCESRKPALGSVLGLLLKGKNTDAQGQRDVF